MTPNLTVSKWIIERLLQKGVSHFIISPGSRSTPLTVAVARSAHAVKMIHFDERGAAFYALGSGKATGRPAVLICTSGTAVANYFPAVVEASLDNIPLIILSADRPPELIDVGANQAIFQENIYGTYPRLFKNLDPPRSETIEAQIFTIVDELFHAAIGSRPGPVQLNCQFREPLLPTGEKISTDPDDTPNILRSEDPPTYSHWQTVKTGQSKKETENYKEHLQHIIDQIESSQQGLLIVGRSVDSTHNDAILRLSEALGWPVFADIQSSLRFIQHDHIIHHFDLSLLNAELQLQKVDMVIHFGGPFTSKRLLSFIHDPQLFYVSVKETPGRIDPNHQMDIAFLTSAGHFCKSLLAKGLTHSDRSLQTWQRAEIRTLKIIQDHLSSANQLSEPAISFELSRSMPSDHSLMLANSMAIREMEMFGEAGFWNGAVTANRGASGIDGLLATAAGYQSGSETSMTLLIGDLAALHDLNSLSLIKQSLCTIIVVIINNRGGGIFHFLPVERETDIFETYFGTPHNFSFRKPAEMFGLEYANPPDMAAFRETYMEATAGGKSTIIEINTDRYENYKFHQEIFATIRDS